LGSSAGHQSEDSYEESDLQTPNKPRTNPTNTSPQKKMMLAHAAVARDQE